MIGVRDESRLATLRAALSPMLEIGSPLALIPPPRLLLRFVCAPPGAAQGGGLGAAH